MNKSLLIFRFRYPARNETFAGQAIGLRKIREKPPFERNSRTKKEGAWRAPSFRSPLWSPVLHVVDDLGPKLGTLDLGGSLELTGKVVGHLLLLDGVLHAL